MLDIILILVICLTAWLLIWRTVIYCLLKIDLEKEKQQKLSQKRIGLQEDTKEILKEIHMIDEALNKIASLEAEKVLLLDALKKIGAGKHLDTCRWVFSEELPCNCHVSIACAAYLAMGDDTRAEICEEDI